MFIVYLTDEHQYSIMPIEAAEFNKVEGSDPMTFEEARAFARLLNDSPNAAGVQD